MNREDMQIPVVELKIRALGEEIVHATSLHADEIVDRIAHAVKTTVETFNFEKYVHYETERALEAYMTDGPGGEAIRDMAFKLGEQILNEKLKTKV